eukprot:1360921-Rhodomonas_salina.2
MGQRRTMTRTTHVMGQRRTARSADAMAGRAQHGGAAQSRHSARTEQQTRHSARTGRSTHKQAQSANAG